jgi:isopentenyl-diphosphate Delta-isomerase
MGVEKKPDILQDADPTAETRKADHIELAFKAQVDAALIDSRFNYEPFTVAHPFEQAIPPTLFGGHQLQMPVWISSMTGGTQLARTINQNLARACREFGMGMGLGSCRSILSSNERLADFDVRHIMGDELPLYANLGIAQVEKLLNYGQINQLKELVDKLKADGLIIHVNPLQEWMQPEGDRIVSPPLDTIQKVLDKLDIKLIVKEVGQGFGPQSMQKLLELPLEAVEFAANGGTNFALLELLRSEASKQDAYNALTRIGHTAMEMLEMARNVFATSKVRTRHLIISGGIGSFLDGYYAIRNSPLPAVYGQASQFLKYAKEDYEVLRSYVELQKEGLKLAYTYLHPKQ